MDSDTGSKSNREKITEKRVISTLYPIESKMRTSHFLGELEKDIT